MICSNSNFASPNKLLFTNIKLFQLKLKVFQHVQYLTVHIISCMCAPRTHTHTHAHTHTHTQLTHIQHNTHTQTHSHTHTQHTLSMRLATIHWTSSRSISVSPKAFREPSNACSGSWWVPKRRYLMEQGEERSESGRLASVAHHQKSNIWRTCLRS